MYCSKCGNMVDSNAKFCGFCGYGINLFENEKGDIQKEVIAHIKATIKSPTSILRNSKYISNINAMIMILIGVILMNISSVLTMKGYIYQAENTARRISSSLGMLSNFITPEDIYREIMSTVFPNKELFSVFIKGSFLGLLLLISLSAIIYGIFIVIIKEKIEFNQVLSIIAISIIPISILEVINSLVAFISINLNFIIAIAISLIYIMFIYEGLKSATSKKKGICGVVTIVSQLLNVAVLYIFIKIMI